MKNIASRALFAAALLLSLSFATSAATQTATLFYHIKHHDYDRASFSFSLGVPGDSRFPANRNLYDLSYGSISLGDGQDYFDVPINDRSYSQLKDLGELKWDELHDVPVLHASQWPHGDGLKSDFSRSITGTDPELTPANVVVKALLGHLYVLHSKHDRTDIYVLFRIETLKLNDECTISWQIVRSPEEIE
ncbi:MAG: hypothetical protein JO360_04955 [Acidobacteria bacterium]|nr:hypothetical protein [Acidobacteriota bacterium]